MALIQDQVGCLVIAAQRALQPRAAKQRASGRQAGLSSAAVVRRQCWQELRPLTTIVRPSFVITDTVAAGRGAVDGVLEELWRRQ